MIIIILLILVMGCVTLGVIGVNNLTWVNTSFATSASMKCHYNEKAIDAVITDADDLKALKEILSGFAYTEHVSCGFTENVTVTLTDGRKSITFYPALSGDPLFEVGNNNQCLHTSDKQRKAFDKILRKYGWFFPL